MPKPRQRHSPSCDCCACWIAYAVAGGEIRMPSCGASCRCPLGDAWRKLVPQQWKRYKAKSRGELVTPPHNALERPAADDYLNLFLWLVYGLPSDLAQPYYDWFGRGLTGLPPATDEELRPKIAEVEALLLELS